jgi:hypothetical protein
MFPPSSKTSPASKSFLWTFPECPVRIHINLQFIERLSKQILGPAHAELEVGGLLIGQELSHAADIEVSDHFQLPPASESTRNFAVCSESLDQSIKTASTTQGRVIGFYRTHLDQRMQLRPEDLECALSKFKDPMNVFLLVRPHDGRASGAFFFWQDGAVNGGLTFPFSSTELKSSSWSTLVGGSPRPSPVQGLIARAKERALETSSGARIGVVVLIAILLAAAGALRFYRSPSTSPPETPQALGLRIERALLGIVVAWNPAAPEIATAKDADLLIWDGSSPPAFVRLTTAQLHAGRTFFTSFSDRVEVRLDIIGPTGRARTESLVSVSHAPDLDLPSPPAKAPPSAPVGVKPATPPQPVEKAHAAPIIPAPVPENPAPVALPEEQAAGAFQTAVPIRETRPEVPPELRSQIQSDNVVEVQVSISALGKVTAAKLASVRGPVAASLSKSALNAALAWQFRPATQNGEAVPSDKILEFLFRPSSR